MVFRRIAQDAFPAFARAGFVPVASGDLSDIAQPAGQAAQQEARALQRLELSGRLPVGRPRPFKHRAVGNNIKYLLSVWLVITPVQIFFAYMLHIRIPAHRWLRLMLFLPYVISTSIVGFFSIIVFDPNIGLLNGMLKSLGLPQSAWLGDPNLVFPLYVMVVIWQSIGRHDDLLRQHAGGTPGHGRGLGDRRRGRAEQVFRVAAPVHLVPDHQFYTGHDLRADRL